MNRSYEIMPPFFWNLHDYFQNLLSKKSGNNSQSRWFRSNRHEYLRNFFRPNPTKRTVLHHFRSAHSKPRPTQPLPTITIIDWKRVRARPAPPVTRQGRGREPESRIGARKTEGKRSEENKRNGRQGGDKERGEQLTFCTRVRST